MKRRKYKVSGLNLIRKLLGLIKEGHRLYHVVKGDNDLSFETDEGLDVEVKKTFSHVFDKTITSSKIRWSIVIPIVICTIVVVVASLFVYDIEVYGYDEDIVKDVVGVENYKCAYKGNIDTQAIEEAICRASQLTTLRIGDFMAVELAPSGLLATDQDGTVSFKASYCENDLYDLKIIF